MRFRTAFRSSLFLILAFSLVSESKLFHKSKPIIVRREIETEKTRLADGTKFERFVERDLPPLPVEEEEADDLNDPRIGHLDKDGGIAVPVDSNGKVLKGYEYLLKPITIDLDLDENDDSRQKPVGDRFEAPVFPGNENSKDYKPYPNNQDISPKSEFLGDETNGDEYDDVPSEPKEQLPNVPDLPKPDYTDSGESDENLKADEDLDEKEEDETDSEKRVGDNEVIIPSAEIQQIPIPVVPVSEDEVDEKNKSADEVEKETEIKSDEDNGDKSVDIPKNRVVGDTDIDDTPRGEEVENGGEETERDENEIDLNDAELENLAKDLGKSVYENVMNRAKEFNESDDEEVDPNTIASQSDTESNVNEVEEVIGEESDGVILPEQSLSDEELARIAAESLKPAEPIVPAAPARPPVRGGRIGSGVQPDSASQHNILIQFFLVSLAVIFV